MPLTLTDIRAASLEGSPLQIQKRSFDSRVAEGSGTSFTFSKLFYSVTSMGWTAGFSGITASIEVALTGHDFVPLMRDGEQIEIDMSAAGTFDFDEAAAWDRIKVTFSGSVTIEPGKAIYIAVAA